MAFISCNEEELDGFGGPGPNSSGRISLVNEQGIDLLNPENEGHYDPKEFREYAVLKDGSLKKIANSWIGKYGISFSADQEKNYVEQGKQKVFSCSAMFFYNEYVHKKRSKIIICWNKTEKDTIECELENDTFGYNMIEHVYVNGVLTWTIHKTISPIINDTVPLTTWDPEIQLVKKNNNGN